MTNFRLSVEKDIFRTISVLFYIMVFVLQFNCVFAESQQKNKLVKEKKWIIGFSGVLPIGDTQPCMVPEDENHWGPNPLDKSYGFGVTIENSVGTNLRIFLDGNYYIYRKLVAEEGLRSWSHWVFENNDYGSWYTGTFTKDAYFDMEATGFRVGAKYAFVKKNFRPWVGLGVGIYSWKASYMTSDRKKTWGFDSGFIGGVTYLVGVDFIVNISETDKFVLTFFGDFASPVANPKIENLFYNGWTWENSGGNHIMGPYRFGVSIGFTP